MRKFVFILTVLLVLLGIGSSVSAQSQSLGFPTFPSSVVRIAWEPAPAIDPANAATSFQVTVNAAPIATVDATACSPTCSTPFVFSAPGVYNVSIIAVNSGGASEPGTLVANVFKTANKPDAPINIRIEVQVVGGNVVTTTTQVK